MKPEAATLKLITDWLSAERIWFRRRNAGLAIIPASGGQARRKIAYGVAGDSDLEVIYRARTVTEGYVLYETRILFVEVKAPKGKQSEAQKRFQEEVEALGCTYCLAYSLEDVQAALGMETK